MVKLFLSPAAATDNARVHEEFGPGNKSKVRCSGFRGE